MSGLAFGSSFGSADVGASASSSSGRRVRKRRRSGVSSDVSSNDVSLPMYMDCGDPVHMCSYCSSLFWYDERLSRSTRAHGPLYSQCCKGGTVVLPAPPVPSSALFDLYQDSHFRQNIRAYNAMFSMTSFGARVDDSVNSGNAPYTFKVSGQVSHWIGSLCPQPPEKPRFLQLYVYDTQNEVQNRLQFFPGQDRLGLKPEVVASLSQILLRHNEYVRTFKNAVQIANENHLQEYSIRLYNNVSDVRYGLPQSGTLGAIIVADDPNASHYDIVVRSRHGPPHRISKLHLSYMPLQYPLLFPYGESGWSTRLRLRSDDDEGNRSLTVNMYYSYLIHSRHGVFSLLLHGGRLFQQFLLDAYLCIEDSRLDYIRSHQNQLRSEYVTGVYDAISRGDSVGRQIGKRVFLPSTFVGGPRYMYKHYQDALALCRVYGNPQYFITFTCNVRWPEISRFMDTHAVDHSQNRPDIISRVFQMKVSHFISYLKEEKPFGTVSAYLYTIEFQKRGLPHCHTLLWVNASSAIRSPTDVDKYISAELPDPVTEAALYSTVTSCMIHGPCGSANVSAPCMQEGICRKKFPKPFSYKTFFDKDGYVHYKRRECAFHTLRNGIRMHNGYVVPYNKKLSSRFDAHINVEYCGWNMLIKYLFKYISKGVERVSFALHKAEAVAEDSSTSVAEIVNEIQNFIDGRFICPHKAAWRILNFSIHERHPSVQVLAVHLENMQNVTFNDNAALRQMVNNAKFGNSTLTRWLVSNRWDPDGRSLTYVEYCSLFRWNAAIKDCVFRTSTAPAAIGRLKGCRRFQDIRNVGGIVYSSYQLACETLGLIGDDREWLAAFVEASSWASSSELRSLFSHLLLFCEVSNPTQLWEHAWPKMGDDIMHTLNNSTSSVESVVSEDHLKQYILFEVEKLLNASTPRKSLSNFRLPLPSASMLLPLRNRLLLEETMYDTVSLQMEHAEMAAKLNPDQLRIYSKVRYDHELRKQTFLFVYGYGGTGKTFLWSTILSYFRSIGKVILDVAASGIASLLLPNGRTSHSRFNIPLDLSDTSMCDIKKRTQLAELLEHTTMVIRDEATMTDRRSFECVDRSLRDILGKKDEVFGGMSMLLGGDFRQTL